MTSGANSFEHYVDHPWCIFHGWNAALIHEKLLKAVHDANSTGRPIDDLVLRRLSWYPSIVSVLINRGMLSLPQIERILERPEVRFRTMVESYDRHAPVLEAKLLEDPESVERIIRWTAIKAKDSFHPRAEYEARLGDDPNRHHRITPPEQRKNAPEMLAIANRKKHSVAAYALLFISCSTMSSLPAELIQVLSQSEEYSYLGGLLMRQRRIAVDNWVRVLDAVKSPRWAFHVARDIAPGCSLPREVEDRIMKVVHSSPPWAVQLWESRGWSGDTLEWASGQCSFVAEHHECTEELFSWLRLKRATSRPAALQEVV